jgi:hypothetical protein
MRKKWATIGGIVMAMAMATVAQATPIPITGSISMGGVAYLNSSDLAAATTVTNWGTVLVNGVNGDFSSSVSAYTSVSMAVPWIFIPSTATPNLWSVGGFTFSLVSDSVTESGDSLDILGFGTISSTNSAYASTAFEWNVSIVNNPSQGPVYFSFSASTVPDGGMTVAFLGLALASAEGLRRKFHKTRDCLSVRPRIEGLANAPGKWLILKKNSDLS